jgi:hypothetical protein
MGSKFVFYVDHMALVYLVNKPQVFRRTTKWLLLFLEYEFTVVYKPNKIHVVVDDLFKLPDISKPLGILNHIVDASLFYVEPIWTHEEISYLKTC